jgi:hypothetical protein
VVFPVAPEDVFVCASADDDEPIVPKVITMMIPKAIASLILIDDVVSSINNMLLVT